MILDVMGIKKCLRMYREERDVFERLITDCVPQNGRYLEIGTGDGGTALLAYSVRPDLEIFTVDSFDSNNIGFTAGGGVAKKNLKPYSNIHLIVKDTEEAFQDESLKDFDIIFIDGGHDYETVLFDITHWPERLKADGVFAGHDYNEAHKDVVRAINEIFGFVYVDRVDKPKHSVWTHKKVGPCVIKKCLNLEN